MSKMWRTQLVLLIIAFTCVYGDDDVYSVDYVLAPFYSPYIYKLQSDSNIHNLWIRSYPLYDSNVIVSMYVKQYN